MTDDEMTSVQNFQISQLAESVKELRIANERQRDFNREVIKFMATVATWGKVGMLLWSVFAALLVWAITLQNH